MQYNHAPMQVFVVWNRQYTLLSFLGAKQNAPTAGGMARHIRMERRVLSLEKLSLWQEKPNRINRLELTLSNWEIDGRR